MKHTNMDEGLKHEKMTQVLTERGRPPSPRPAVLTNQWDSVESDTESLAQERAYQQQELQMPIGRHGQNKYILPQKENADSLQQGHEEADDANDNETEDLQVCDSLDVAAHPHANRNPTLSQTEYLDTQMDERAGTSQLLTDDVYSGLRYDPNWRTNLRGASCFNESPRISVEEYYKVPKEKSRQSCGYSQGLRIKAGYRYIIDTSPAAVVTPHLTGDESDQPYRLHPQHDQTSSVTSPHCYNHALQLGSPEADHSKPSCIFTKDDSDNAGEYSRSPEQPNDKCSMSKNIQEHTQGGPTQIQQMSSPSVPKVLVNKKLERLNEDIVERNKKTLGRNTSKCGSYVSVHALNREMPHHVNKVTQISEGKKAQRKENPNRPPEQQQTPALGVSAELGDRLSSPLAKPAAVGQPDPQKTTSSQPLVPNIHLNTSSPLLPLIQQRGQEDSINLTSLHACPNWRPVSELALSPGYQLTIPGRSPQTSHKGVSAHLHQPNLESSPEQWQRTAALKWPLSFEGEDQKCPNEVPTKQFSPNLPRTPTTIFSGSYIVLPPITESKAGIEPELSPGVNTAYPIHRSCSDSYLGQMEKQKQLRTRVAYKHEQRKRGCQTSLQKIHMQYMCLPPSTTLNNKPTSPLLPPRPTHQFTTPLSLKLSPSTIPTPQSSSTPFSMTDDQVRSQLKKIKARKAPGPDGISPSLLRDCADQLCGVLRHLFNLSLSLEKVPALWRTSCVVPVPKSPRPREPNHFRPVALTSHLMKTTERIILCVGKQLDPLQFAYQPGIGVDDAVIYLLHRSLLHLEAYSLKDYKQLKSDINLRGLGPDYSAIEKTKMKRQKLYSNVIREQNKTISRIPFLLAKDPEGNDKKVPRMKALEYAKTIAKPPVQSQPKQRPKHRSEGFTEPAPYLEDLDVSQLATLDVLRKRHEEEKQAVALFRKVHAV